MFDQLGGLTSFSHLFSLFSEFFLGILEVRGGNMARRNP
jgi:hypothetical protein